jgi:hypothetical protein
MGDDLLDYMLLLRDCETLQSYVMMSDTRSTGIRGYQTTLFHVVYEVASVLVF